MYRSYICESCGYSSEEVEGVYLCPKCHNKMRIATYGGVYGGGDSTRTQSKWLWYVVITIIALPILLLCFNVFGIIIYIALILLIRRNANKQVRDNAIPVNDVAKIENLYYCRNCGYKLKNEKFCPNCGEKVLHK